MNKQNNYKKFIAYLFILFFSVTGLVYAINQVQIKEQGGSQDTNTKGAKDGVVVSKNISKTETENFFDITLKVDTEDDVVSITKDPDIALVVVMDISDSMLTGYVEDGNSRFVAAQLAAKQLIEEYTSYSADVNAVRKFAFVGFNTNAHKILELQDIKTANATKAKEKATALYNKVKSDSDTIVTSLDKYGQVYTGNSYTRFTNMEGGLKMANDILSDSSLNGIENKYILLLSDGIPTTYLNNTTTDAYDGYNPYMRKATDYNEEFDTSKTYDKSEEGVFYNELMSQETINNSWWSSGLNILGTSYSDRATIKARNEAARIKNKKIKIYSVGVGFGADNVNRMSDMDNSLVVDVDKETYIANGNKYEAGRTYGDFKNWLEYKIGYKDKDSSGTYYYDTNDTAALKAAYQKIFQKITEESEKKINATWVAEDPMGTDGGVKNIEFIGLYDDKGVLKENLTNNTTDQTDTASFTNNQITWDLKKSQYTTSKVGTKTMYHYEIKYRVRLENELDSFKEETIYKTNGHTKLTYVTRINNILSQNKEIVFPEPSVIGYLGELEFDKWSSIDDTPLEGAKFKLVHDETNCDCKKGFKNMTTKKVSIGDFTATSDASGKVKFNNIPSGHTYILSETGAAVDHDKSLDTYTVTVRLDNTTSNLPNNIFYNDIQKGSLTIKKVVEGNDTYSGDFKFKLVVKYKNKVIKDEIITLKRNETIMVSDLPVGATYTITETTTDGFKVYYNVNQTGEILGDTATCNQENSCRINTGLVNTVTFTNVASYILPATGSSGMLILVIVGTLLLMSPIIYIIYTLLKKRSLS